MAQYVRLHPERTLSFPLPVFIKLTFRSFQSIFLFQNCSTIIESIRHLSKLYYIYNQWRSKGYCRPGPNIYGRPYWCSRNTFASEIAAPVKMPPPRPPPLCSATDYFIQRRVGHMVSTIQITREEIRCRLPPPPPFLIRHCTVY